MPGYGSLIDASNPLTAHSLNAGRKLCLRAARNSGWRGGFAMRDLTRLYDSTLTGFTNPLWAGATQPGQDGSVVLSGAQYVASPAFQIDSANCSVAATFVLTSNLAGRNTIIDMGSPTSTSYWLVEIGTSVGTNTWRVFNSANTPNFSGANSIISLNTLYRVMVTVTGTTWAVYLNGVLSAPQAGFTFTNTGPNTSAAKNFGRRGSANSNFFNGNLFEVSMWNRVIGPAEAELDWQEQKQGCPQTINWRDISIPGAFMVPAGGAAVTSSWYYERLCAG